MASSLAEVVLWGPFEADCSGSGFAPACRLQTAALFDHLVGAGEEGGRDFEAERLGGPEIDQQLILGRRLHRQVGGLLSLEDAVHIPGRATVLIDEIRAVRDETARGGEVAVVINRGKLMSRRSR